MILKIKYETRHSKFDQENIKKLTEDWESQGSNVLFQKMAASREFQSKVDLGNITRL